MPTNQEAWNDARAGIHAAYEQKNVWEELPLTKQYHDAVKAAQNTFIGGFAIADDVAKGDYDKLVADAKSTIGEAAGYVAEAASTISDIVSDPIGWLIQNGLSFLFGWIEPLQDLLELVTGDPEALTAGADAFSTLGDQIEQLRGDTEKMLAEGLSTWEGEAAEAAGRKLAAFRDGMSGTAGAAGELAALLSVSSMVMQVAKDIVLGIISDFVEWLIITWIAALAAAGPTFGASTAGATGATAANASINTARGTQQVSKVRRIIDKIKELIEKIKAFFQRAKEIAKNPLESARDIGGSKLKALKADAKDMLDEATSAGGKAKDFLENPLRNTQDWAKSAPERFQENFVNKHLGSEAADALRSSGERTARERIDDANRVLVEQAREKFGETVRGSVRDTLKERFDPRQTTEVHERDADTRQRVRDADGGYVTTEQLDAKGTYERSTEIYDELTDPLARRSAHGDPDMSDEEIDANLDM